MASTKTIQQTMNWAQYFIGNRSMSLANLEPALTSANIVCQVMLQPPFKWRWNRKTVSFAYTVAAESPVVDAISDFGFIEKAFVVGADAKVVEIPNIYTNLSNDTGIGQPNAVAPYLDDNAGNITFGFMPGTPDQDYTVNVIYQKKPVLLSALTQTWPIPDEYGFVYDWGFLALMYLFADSTKFGPANQKFISGLLGIAEGLGEQDIAIFLGQWDFLIQNQMRMTAKTQQGYTGRQA